ncbi:hypothetical protein ACIQCQ_40965, partial [Streptomyces sp. NPDC088394]|uniref:hypothetical protein n=1 Tax=Streptomyces sp. NPDC088394 TaxID=3365860 RepID=UPI0037F4BA29
MRETPIQIASPSSSADITATSGSDRNRNSPNRSSTSSTARTLEHGTAAVEHFRTIEESHSEDQQLQSVDAPQKLCQN